MSATNLETAREIWTSKDGPWHKIPYNAAKVAVIVFDRLARRSFWRTFSGVVEAFSAQAREMLSEVESLKADPWPYVGNEYSWEVLPYTAESAENWTKAQDSIPYSAKRPRRA
jgi:hypothetical protein